MLRAGALELRPREHLALVDGRGLALSAREVELLAALVRCQQRVVERSALYRQVWGTALRPDDRSVDVYVHKLRAKLASAAPQLALHPHAHRRRLPLRPGAFTAFSRVGHTAATGCGLSADTLRPR